MIYNEVLKIDMDDVEANFELGVLYLRETNDYQKAIYYFSQAVK
jgi:TPR repeat protein